MIRRFILTLALLIFPLAAFAASFTATVDSPDAATGESVSLQLTLTGAQPKGNPDTQVLAKDFDIAGQSQTSETSIINGMMSSNLGWQLTLLPKHDGHLTIPPVSIDTSSGSLATQPVALDIGGPATSASGKAQGTTQNHFSRTAPVTVTASVDTNTPYQNQPVIYTIRVVAHADLSNLSLGDVVADGAIVQPQGKPAVTDSVENGQPVKVLEFHYLVTPMQAKEITISPVRLQGAVESQNDIPIPGHLHGGMMDPFSLFQSMGMGRFSGFATMRPFSVSSNTIELKTRPPAVEMDPWLPLKNLRIEQTVDPQQPVRIGDPITRTFTLTAEGMGGSQLPNLESQLTSPNYKIYADKPKTEDSIGKSSAGIAGRREESFNLIPLKAGHLTLPNVKLAWWDVTTDRIAYAEAPEVVVEVLPGIIAPTESATPLDAAAPSSVQSPQVNTSPEKATSTSSHNDFHYLFYAITVGFLIVLIIIGIRFKSPQQVKTVALDGNTQKEKDPVIPPKLATTAEPDWDQILDPAQLNEALMNYAHSRWNAPRHITLETVFSRATFATEEDRQEAANLSRELVGALYGGKTPDIAQLKSRFRHLMNGFANTTPAISNESQNLPPLNPS
jgi:hypothetical protein